MVAILIAIVTVEFGGFFSCARSLRTYSILTPSMRCPLSGNDLCGGSEAMGHHPYSRDRIISSTHDITLHVYDSTRIPPQS